jgi:carboxymethylenebutenolidase
MSETVQIPTLDASASIPSYVARPVGEAKAAIIVIPEIFGVNAGIRQKCDGWAAKGYLAVAPDLFWRFAPGVELDPDVEARGLRLFPALRSHRWRV